MAKITENSSPTRQIVNADYEAWILSRLTELVILAQDLQKLRGNFVAASQPMIDGALTGAVNGAAIEIIHTLNMEPGYVNIKKQDFSIWDRITMSHTSVMQIKE